MRSGINGGRKNGNEVFRIVKMNSKQESAMFIIAALLIYFGGFVYIAWRINAGLGIQPPFKWHLTAGITALGLPSIAALIGSRVHIPGISFIGPFGYICMGAWGIFFTFFIFNDILNLFNLIFKIKKFGYYSSAAVIIISALCCVWSLINAGYILNIKEITLKSALLPADSLKIVHLSDLHINAFTPPTSIRKIFDKVNSLEPDIILITGDVIDADINKENKFLEYGFSLLKAKYGIFAVTGNHEYYTGAEAFFDMFKKLGVPVLRNESITVGGLVNIAGINDYEFKNPQAVEKALSGTDPSLPVLFMSHRPEAFDIASLAGKSIIQFSGHTHAGQIPPIEVIRRLMKYNYGLYENKDSKMYITSGVRWWGPPMRLANTSEIAVIKLVKQ